MAAGIGSSGDDAAGILPGVISYPAVFSACEKDQQWQQALGFSGVDAADSCSAWRHFLLSRDQCL